MVGIEGMVHAGQMRPHREWAGVADEVVVFEFLGTGLVRLRPESEKFLRHGTDEALGNGVSRERRPLETAVGKSRSGIRIVHLIGATQRQERRKIALLHGRGGNRVGVVVAVSDVIFFPKVEPEGLVLAVVELRDENRTTGAGAVAVVLERSDFLSRTILEDRRRIEYLVAIEEVPFAVQVVGAALQTHVHQRAGGMADGGVVGQALHPKLAHRHLRRNEDNALVHAVRNAVNGEVAVSLARAVHREVGLRGGRAHIAHAKIGRVDHAGR